jgi:hypothetical protein
VPAGSRWTGNPIAPWREPTKRSTAPTGAKAHRPA